MELNFTKLYDEVVSSNIFTKAYKYAVKSRISDLFLESKARSGGYADVISARVIGKTGEYETRLVLNQDGGYDSCDCTCSYYQKNQKPCKHIVALSYYYSEIFGKADLSQKEESVVKNAIFSQYTDMYQRDLSLKDKEKIQVVPYLVQEQSGFFIRFKVGIDKLYTVKDIYEFARVLSQNQVFKYGEKLEFTHTLDAFSPQFFRLLKFICAACGDAAVTLKSNDYRLGLPFQGEIADIVYELLKSKALQSDILDKTFQVEKSNPALSVAIEKRGNLFYLYSKNPSFYLVPGLENYYAITSDAFLQLSESHAKKLLPLYNNLKQNKQIALTAEHLKEWFLNLQPMLLDAIAIEYIGFSESAYMPKELVAKLYLDGDADKITADLKCFYGEEQTDIFGKNRGFIIQEYALKTLLLNYFKQTEQGFVIDTDESQYDFLTFGIFELEKLFEVYSSEKFSAFKVQRSPNLTAAVRVDNQLLKISAQFEEGYTREEILKILAAYRQNKKYVKISGNRFVSLFDSKYDILNDLQQISGKSYESIVGGEVATDKYRILQIDRLLKESDVSYNRDALFKETVAKIKSFEEADFFEGDFEKVLRHYQKVGFRWMKSLAHFGFGGILADDMGLGKSLQTIAFLCTQNSSKPSLIVCPSSLILNWQSEFLKFSGGTKTLCVYGTKKVREQLLAKKDGAQVIITSYELLRQDIEIYEAMKFYSVVIDEAQFIKNHGTKNAKAVKSIQSDFRFALSGTPIENNIAELWSIFDFLMPGYLYSYAKFRDTFEIPIVREGNKDVASRLHKMVSPFILRRLKKDVLKELPQKIENSLLLPLEEKQKDVYAAHLLSIKEEILNMSDYDKNKVTVLAHLLRLRQICCSPSLLYSDYDGNNAKLDAALNLICQSIEGGHKVLLFSQFTSMLDIIKKRLEEMDVKYYLLQGDTKKEARQEMTERFNTDDTGVFLLSLKAGGTGLNLTGADIVIHYDPWWNLSVQNQASDRAHRIGQEKTVQVYKLILQDTIEESILSLQERKQQLFETVIKAGETDFMSMTKDQLLSMLGQ